MQMVMIAGCLVHRLSIVIVWSLGRAQGLVFPISDAAVLVPVMIGVTLVPISISGWGLRELAVISLLGHYGIRKKDIACLDHALFAGPAGVLGTMRPAPERLIKGGLPTEAMGSAAA